MKVLTLNVGICSQNSPSMMLVGQVRKLVRAYEDFIRENISSKSKKRSSFQGEADHKPSSIRNLGHYLC